MAKIWRAKAARTAATRQRGDIQTRNAQFGLSWDNIVFNPLGVGEEGWAEFQERAPNEAYQGKKRAATYRAMASKYKDGVSDQDSEKWIKEMILSGSTLPDERQVKKGTTFIKLIKIDDPRILQGNNSPYYIDERQFVPLLKGNVDLEQQLGLPTTSHGAFYKIYFLKAKRATTVFQSTIAQTEQYEKDKLTAATGQGMVQGFTTTGGARQTLIIDSQDSNIWEANSREPLILNSARVVAPMKWIWELADFEKDHPNEQVQGIPPKPPKFEKWSPATRKFMKRKIAEINQLNWGD
jgi:hypothetical protein